MAIEIKTLGGIDCREDVANQLRSEIHNLDSLQGNRRKVNLNSICHFNTKECNNKEREIGCKPDFNTYTGNENSKASLINREIRSLGGHIHIGIKDFLAHDLFKSTSDSYGTKVPYSQIDIHKTKPSQIRCYDPYYAVACEGPRPSNGMNISYRLKPLQTESARYQLETYTNLKNRTIRWLDKTAGIAGTILDNPLLGKLRKDLYGKAGDYRTTPYGLEYRTLSSFWIASPLHVSLILGMVRMGVAMSFIEPHLLQYIDKALLNPHADVKGKNKLLELRKVITQSEQKLIINQCNVDKAKAYFIKVMEIFDMVKNKVGFTFLPGGDFELAMKILYCHESNGNISFRSWRPSLSAENEYNEVGEGSRPHKNGVKRITESMASKRYKCNEDLNKIWKAPYKHRGKLVKECFGFNTSEPYTFRMWKEMRPVKYQMKHQKKSSDSKVHEPRTTRRMYTNTPTFTDPF
jgi:hypothetical protein